MKRAVWVVEIKWKGKSWRPANISLHRQEKDAREELESLDCQLNFQREYKLRVVKYTPVQKRKTYK